MPKNRNNWVTFSWIIIIILWHVCLASKRTLEIITNVLVFSIEYESQNQVELTFRNACKLFCGLPWRLARFFNEMLQFSMNLWSSCWLCCLLEVTFTTKNHSISSFHKEAYYIICFVASNKGLEFAKKYQTYSQFKSNKFYGFFSFFSHIILNRLWLLRRQIHWNFVPF